MPTTCMSHLVLPCIQHINLTLDNMAHLAFSWSYPLVPLLSHIILKRYLPCTSLLALPIKARLPGLVEDRQCMPTFTVCLICLLFSFSHFVYLPLTDQVPINEEHAALHEAPLSSSSRPTHSRTPPIHVQSNRRPILSPTTFLSNSLGRPPFGFTLHFDDQTCMYPFLDSFPVFDPNQPFSSHEN